MALPPKNPTAPHKVIIWFRAEVRELLPSGEIHGNIAHTHPSKAEGPWEVFALNAQDRDIAIRKLNELITELRQKGFQDQ